MTSFNRSILVSTTVCLAAAYLGFAESPQTNVPSRISRDSSDTAGLRHEAVSESARDIPVSCDVDVVVVGGTSGGVAAAVEAARRGASVFLAASRPYLGQDLCGTYRLWLEPEEKPTSVLAKKVFAEPARVRQPGNTIGFKYEADKPSADLHKDTQPPSLLADGKWHSAPAQSVQYDGDVNITIDLGAQRRLQAVYVMAYQRDNDFEVESVAVSISDDGQRWIQTAVIKNSKLGQGSFEQSAITLSAPVNREARHLKLHAKKGPNARRILLGEICIEPEQPETEQAPTHRVPPAPMQVKRTFDQALLEAGVDFLFGCYATDVLRDATGKPAGIVMVNCSGRQAVKAKLIIDATPRASVARAAGARFQPYPSGTGTFTRVVVGGKLRTGEGIESRRMPTPVQAADGRQHEAVEYTLAIPMKDSSFASFAEAEQIARDKTWNPGQMGASEMLFQVPPDPVKAEEHLAGAWPGAEKVSLDVFRPAGTERLYVLGGCADMSRAAARRMLRPLELMKVGRRIGAAAALQAKTLAKSGKIRLPGKPTAAVSTGDIREDLSGIRMSRAQLGTVGADERAVPVLGEYDVVVLGGGTGGAPAGISAARHGARTLVVEYLHGLGGVGTLGLISSYYYGNRTGFTAEIDRGLAELGGQKEGSSGEGKAWNNQLKAEWYRRELRKAGADVWFRTLGCGAFVEAGKVKGIVVATPEGRGVVLAKVVIDATGNAAVAAAAGAACLYTDGSHIAVQGTGLPPLNVGARYTNTDWTFIDDVDVADVWRAFVVAKDKFPDAYDLGQLVDTRERRQIVGDFFLSPLDVYKQRTFPDTIVMARSNFDSHGFTIHPMFLLRPPDRKVIACYVPYRCLLPRGLDGLLVTGLGVSAHRDVMPVIRMQPDIQNQGYAAGLAASMAVRTGKSLRDIDVRALQAHLVEKGSLPEQVLTHRDSFPLPREEIARAVKTLVNNFEGLETIFTQPQEALPMLVQEYERYCAMAPEGPEVAQARLTYAHILGIMGDASGVSTLVETVESMDWDKGWKFTGMGQFGASMSPLDSFIVALGRTRKE
ncbi:MAG: FAD-dependent oxidoreductase, partial [Phycisphaerales bacterium]